MLDSLNKAFECTNYDELSDEDDAITKSLAIVKKKKNSIRSKRNL